MTGPVPILMYHAVAHQPARRDVLRLSVEPGAFADQMALLAERGFRPVTTQELAHAWRTGGALPERPMLITFDDGYAGVHQHALPVLATYGFPATLFITTGWLHGDPYGSGDAPDVMLDWPQLRELAEAGMEIGGHSHTHPQLDQLDDTSLRYEVARCRELLSAGLGRDPVSFAHPFGYSDRRVREVVRASGFRQSLAVGNALADWRRQSPYSLARLTVRRSTTREEFIRLIEGQAIGRTFLRDRAMTKGYAAVRRSRQVLRKVRRTRV